jgi:hypothetical protein
MENDDIISKLNNLYSEGVEQIEEMAILYFFYISTNQDSRYCYI